MATEDVKVRMFVMCSRLVRLACVPILAVALLSACSKPMHTGSISPEAGAPLPQAELRRQASQLHARYKRNPGNAATAVALAETLHALGYDDQSLAILKSAAEQHPKDRQVLAAYGRGLARGGQAEEAASILQRAEAAGAMSPQLLSAQGVTLDQLGRHKEAQERYRRALSSAPDDPKILANLGLSLALANEIDTAEQVLREAAALPGADGRVRQNLALVLGLQGKYDEAEEISRRDLGSEKAQENVAYLKEMRNAPESWQKLSGLDGGQG